MDQLNPKPKYLTNKRLNTQWVAAISSYMEFDFGLWSNTSPQFEQRINIHVYVWGMGSDMAGLVLEAREDLKMRKFTMKYLPLEFEITRNAHIINYSDEYLAKGDG